MDVVKGAVGCAVVALLAGHQLSSLDAGRRAALWNAARDAVGAKTPDPSPVHPADRPTLTTRVAAAPPPSPFGEERIPADRMGQFQTTVEIDGQRLPALVDTGATFVSLSAEDADRIGVRPAPSDYRYAVSTANGRARVAKVQLGQTLLGMSFLSRLSSVRIDRGGLVLTR